MKKFVVTVLFLAILLLVVWRLDFGPLNSWLSGVLSPGSTRLAEGPPIMSVVKLRELVSLKVRMKTILSGKNNWYEGIWDIEGDALFSTDCSCAEWANVDPRQRSLTVRLSEPRAIMCRVDHESTSLYDFRSTSWNPAQLICGNPGELRDEAMKHAQLKLEEEATRYDYVVQAKDQAECNLRGFYQPLGWNVVVEWKR